MAIFPGAISTDADLLVGANFKTAITTDNPLTIGATTVNVNSTTGFPTVGALLIDSELIKYTGLTGTSFTGCTRAFDSTTAASHVNGSQVRLVMTAFHHNGLKDEIKAIEQFITDVIGNANTKIKLPDGSAAAPSHTFANDTTAGMYRRTSNTLSFTVGGVAQFEATLGGLEAFNDLLIDTRIKIADGTVSAPAFTFSGALSTGIYKTGATSMRFASGGTNMFSVTAGGAEVNSGVLSTLDGSASVPVWTFLNDPDTGFYRVGANIVAIACGGVAIMDWTSGDMDALVPLNISDGSASVPSLRFSNDTDTGIYRFGANELSVALGGVERFRLTVDNNANDIRMRVWDHTANALVQVSRGAADSGGTGFRALRVPN